MLNVVHSNLALLIPIAILKQSPLTYSGLSLCLFHTMEYITDQDKFLHYLLYLPQISGSVFILLLSHTNLQTVFFSFVLCLKTLQFSCSKLIYWANSIFFNLLFSGIYHCQPFSYFRAFLNIFQNIIKALFLVYIILPINLDPRINRGCFQRPPSKSYCSRRTQNEA